MKTGMKDTEHREGTGLGLGLGLSKALHNRSSSLCPFPSSPQAPSFYWELEVGHMGDSSSDTAHIAMGYSLPPVKPTEGQPWTYPQDTCLIRR